jgi:hypothetical protein
MEIIQKEYNRQYCYNFIINKIAYILGIKHKRLQYEHKNIIERFVLEIINDGIANDSNGEHLFFNDKLVSVELLLEHTNFNKLLSEYREKGVIISDYMKVRIAQIFSSGNYYFRTHKNHVSTTTPSCKIKIYSNHATLTYQDYTKYLSKERYNILANRDNKPCSLLNMVMRYSMFDNSGQQWSIGDNLYNTMVEDFQLGLEMFASPLNFTLPRYCSLFIDTDHPFGSIGDFFSINTDTLIKHNIHGALFNPPYLPLFMNRATTKLLELLHSCKSLNHSMYILAFLPAWYDSEFMKSLNESPYLITNRHINRGEYYLKQRHDDSIMVSNFDISLVVMNSITNQLTKTRDIQRIETIVKNMKLEITMDS